MSKKSKSALKELPNENVVQLTREEIEAQEVKRQEKAREEMLKQCVDCPSHGLTLPAEFRFIEADNSITLIGKHCFKCYAEFFEKNGLKNYK